jgi:hypothetical protein
LEDPLFCGPPRNKTLLLYPPLKPNMLPPVVVAQLLWMKQTLLDYGVKFDCIPLLCDNENAVKIATNLVQHKRTNHIDIHHHFLRDHVGKGNIVMEGVRTDDQLVDIFTKPLVETRFCKLRSELNVIDLSNVA